MKEDKLDNIFKSGLQEHETPVDTNALWDTITPEVVSEKKGKRKAFFFWIIRFGGLALIVAVFALVYWTRDETPTMSGEEGKIKTLSQTPIEKNNPEENQTVTELWQTEANPDSEIPAQMVQRNPEVEEESSPENIKLDDLTMVSEEVELIKIVDDLANKTAEKAPPVSALMRHDDGRPVVLKQHVASENTFHIPPKLDLISPASILYVRNESFREPRLPTESEAQKNYAGKNFEYNLAGYLSAGLIFRDLQPKSEDHMGLFTIRSESEETLESLGGGIKIKLKHKSGLWGASGMDYMQLTERFNYYNQNKRLTFSDTSLTMQTRTVEKRIHNHLKLLSIPVEIGYDLELENWDLTAGAGVLVNLSLKTEGTIMGENLGFIQLGTGQGDIFKNRIGVAYTFGLGVNRSINDQWSVGLSPRMVYFPNSFTQETYNLEQNYWLLTMNAGVCYKF